MATADAPRDPSGDQVDTKEAARADAEREARKLVALAQIRQYPDPVLRMSARPVESFDAELAQLVERLKRLMHDADGAGLAATQIGVLRRVFVMRSGENGETIALVNPELASRGEELETDDEGCLSLQGVLCPVERSTSVRVTATDPQGAGVELDLEGFAARACQHELDHLDGVLMIDRTTDEARREALATLRQRPALAARL